MPTKITDNTVKYNDAQIAKMRTLVTRAIKKLAWQWENEARRIATDESFDTGEFAGTIHHVMFDDGDRIGFRGEDGVKYGIYIEKGTVKHWVPFYKWTGHGYDVNEPILADWGHRVLGLSEEEMLAMGGIQVQNDELRPFLRALLHTQAVASDIFKRTFKETK